MIAYHFTGSHVDGHVLKDYVLEIVQLCAGIPLRICVVTSDMGASNQAMWRVLGFSSHRNSSTVCSIPHPFLEGKELFFTADATHVLKNIRGQLLNSSVSALSDPAVCQHGMPSKEVKLEHVCTVVQYDADADAEGELKVACKLSEVHVSGGHSTKMKVGITVQFFRKAPTAIQYLINEKLLEREAETTVWLSEVVSKW